MKDERVLWLVEKILKNSRVNSKFSSLCSGNSYNTGMPLGNLTSQFFANVYLNELDQFVKHELRTRFYIRYVDDFVILYNSKEILDLWKDQISKFLGDILKLELHPEKTKIIPIYHGTPFLGFRVYYYHKLLKKSNIRNFMRRLEEFRILHEQGQMTNEKIDESIAGWHAYAMHGNTHNLRKSCLFSS
ncbi:MAG: RNA-directed DNA polymerase [Candidatus Aenigmarchaeota archaeon]|nr:RNA-directed DNA polymerase [Candidatus Aenigmarchaeota archaeon]